MFFFISVATQVFGDAIDDLVDTLGPPSGYVVPQGTQKKEKITPQQEKAMDILVESLRPRVRQGGQSISF